MITREWILERIEIYRQAEREHLGLANANHGAIEALQELLSELDRTEAEEDADESTR